MECGNCTLCCKLLTVAWTKSPEGEYCKYCLPNSGCTIFDIADKRCKDYQCAYRQMEKCSEMFRPDKCGIVFEKISEVVFSGLTEKLTEMAKDQIRAFNHEGFSVVVIEPNKTKKTVMLAHGHDMNIVRQAVENKLKERNGSTDLHN